jgi:hypothetical protein
MVVTGLFAASVTMLLFRALLAESIKTFEVLGRRGVVVAAASAGPPGATTGRRSYQAFVDDTRAYLDSKPRQLLTGLLFCGLVLYWWRLAPPSSGFEWLDFGFELLIGFVAGWLTWKVIAVGLKISQLGREFDLKPLLNHPDRCGGLSPLGNLCLLNGLIISPTGAYLGLWIIFGAYTPFRDEALFWQPTYYQLLLVPVIASVLSFFGPLLSVHATLKRTKERAEQELDQAARAVDSLARELLESGGALEPREVERRSRKIERLQALHAQLENLPVWPFNTGIVSRLVLAQLVPLAGFFGLGEKAVEILGPSIGLPSG